MEKEIKEVNLHETMDAMVWTKEFMKRVPNSGVNEGILIGWFANAIMTGFDHANRRNMEKQ